MVWTTHERKRHHIGAMATHKQTNKGTNAPSKSYLDEFRQLCGKMVIIDLKIPLMDSVPTQNVVVTCLFLSLSSHLGYKEKWQY